MGSRWGTGRGVASRWEEEEKRMKRGELMIIGDPGLRVNKRVGSCRYWVCAAPSGRIGSRQVRISPAGAACEW